MELIEIVKKHLKDNGFDGLYNPDECGCGIDDLGLCDYASWGCRPAYKIVKNSEQCGKEDCEYFSECLDKCFCADKSKK